MDDVPMPRLLSGYYTPGPRNSPLRTMVWYAIYTKRSLEAELLIT